MKAKIIVKLSIVTENEHHADHFAPVEFDIQDLTKTLQVLQAHEEISTWLLENLIDATCAADTIWSIELPVPTVNP